MTYMSCNTVSDATIEDHNDNDHVITNPSAHFFEYSMLSGVQNSSMDANNNALFDDSEYACDNDSDGIEDEICGDAMDYTYGWTCRDLTPTQAVALSDAADADQDGDLDGVWSVCDGLTGAEAEASGYHWCSDY